MTLDTQRNVKYYLFTNVIISIFLSRTRYPHNISIES